MAQVALNLVALVASCALALWTLMALQFVVYDTPAPAEDTRPRLDFEILDVDRGQQLVDEPPYARDGGDWTVCTCRLLGGSRAAFYFAERSGPSGDGAPFAWGEAKMWVPSVGDGADLAEALGDAFRVTKGRSRASGSMAASRAPGAGPRASGSTRKPPSST